MKIKLDCDFQIWLTVLDCLCPWNKSLHAAAGGGSSAAAALKLRPAQNQNNKDPIEAIDTDNIKALKKHVFNFWRSVSFHSLKGPANKLGYPAK